VTDSISEADIYYRKEEFSKHLFHLFPSATFTISGIYVRNRREQMFLSAPSL
jgi:hypothetical protein